MNHAAEIFTDQRIDESYEWPCKQRFHFPPNADIWHLRFHWSTIRPQLLQRLRQQTYRLSTMSAVVKANGVRQLQQVLPDYQFVMKTDVKGYYATIDHTILQNQLAKDIKSPFLFRLLCQ